MSPSVSRLLSARYCLLAIDGKVAGHAVKSFMKRGRPTRDGRVAAFADLERLAELGYPRHEPVMDLLFHKGLGLPADAWPFFWLAIRELVHATLFKAG